MSYISINQNHVSQLEWQMLFSEQVSVPTDNCSLMFTLLSLSTLNPPSVSTLYHPPLFEFTTPPLLSTLLPLSAFHTPHPFCSPCTLLPLLFSTLLPFSAFYIAPPFCSPCTHLPLLLSTLLPISALYIPPPFCFLPSSPFLLSMYTPPLAAL